MLPNRNFLITAGTLIPCILQTAINSGQPGYTSCLIPRDVYSENGRVVLMEKGTRVLGEYRGGIQQGQNRLFVLWTRAVTPQGVRIDLASPGADALGRAGLAGAVDSFRSEEHTSELQSLMHISYAVFCLKKKKNKPPVTKNTQEI